MSLLVAAGVQAAQTVMVAVATVLSGLDLARGQSYHTNSGIALTIIGALCVAALGVVATGLARARRWSRTPALLTQLFVGIVGIYLLQGHRLAWGLPSVVLAAAGFAAILAPRSVQALSGERGQPQDSAPRDSEPDGRRQP